MENDDLMGRYYDYYNQHNFYERLTEMLDEAITDPSVSEEYLIALLQRLGTLPIHTRVINKAVILNNVSFFELLLKEKELGYADETNNFFWERVILKSLKEEREDIVKLIFSYKRQDDDLLKIVFKSVFAPQTYFGEVGMHGKKTFVKVVVDLNISLPSIGAMLLSYDKEKMISVFSAEDLFILFNRYLQNLSNTVIESLFGLCLSYNFKRGIIASLWLYDDSLKGVIDESSDYDTILTAAISAGLFLKLDNDKVSGISLYSRRILNRLLENCTDKDIVIEFLNNSEGFELSFVDCDNLIMKDDIDLTPQQLFGLLKFCPEFDVGVKTYFRWYFSEEMITEKPEIVSVIVSRYKGLSKIDFSFGKRFKLLLNAFYSKDYEDIKHLLLNLKKDCPRNILYWFVDLYSAEFKIPQDIAFELIELIQERG